MSFFENEGKTRREFVRDVALAGTAAAIVPSLAAPRPAVAEGKFDRIFKKFIFKKPTGNVGPGCADNLVHLNGSDMEGSDTNFSFGYYSKVGSWTRDSGPIAHPYDTVMMFFGLDPKVPDYMGGAEIEISLGEEREKHTFDAPTVVCIPKNMLYGPIVTKKVEKPFANYTVGLSSVYRTCTEYAFPYQITSTTPADRPTKYGHLVKKLTLPHEAKPRDASRQGPGNADTIVWPRGVQLENFMINCSWGFYSGLGPWHGTNAQGVPADPHIHLGDELLVFVGLDASKPQYLGSQIDYYNGEDSRSGKKQEMVAFDVPMCVCCLAGQLHAPLVTKKVDKTYGFFLIRRDLGAKSNPNKLKDGYPIT
jgi:hypothetical protein